MSLNTFFAIYIIRSISKMTQAIEKVIILFQFVSLGFFFLDILSKSKFLKKIKQLFYLSILIQSCVAIASIKTDIPGYSKISSNLFLIIFSIFYYRDLLDNKPTLILLKSSAFWIVTGIFFYYSVSFPIYSLQPFLGKYSEYQNIKVQIFSISNMALTVMYLLFIKSYLCLKHLQN